MVIDSINIYQKLPIVKTFRYRAAFLNLVLSLSLYLIVIALDLQNSFALMRCYGLYCIIFYGLFIWSEFRLPAINIMAIYLLACFLRLALPIFVLSGSALRGEALLYDRNVITDFVFETSLLMSIYYMSFILIVTIFSGKTTLCIDVRSYFKKRYFLKYVISIYSIVFLVRLFPILTTFSGTITQLLTSLNYVVLLLLAVYCAYNPDEKKSYRLLILIVIVEVAYFAIWGYYKGPIMYVLLFFVLYYFLKCRLHGERVINKKFIIISLFALSFFAFFVYPYISLKRVSIELDNATGDVTKTMSNTEILKNLYSVGLKELDFDELTSFFFSRENAVFANAFFYMSAKKSGFHSELINNNLRLLTPSFLKKEQITETGQLAANFAWGGDFQYSGVTTSEYCGIVGGAYFWGGYFAIFLAIILNSLTAIGFIKYMARHIDFPVCLLLFVIFLINATTAFEEVHDGGFMQDIYYLLLLLFSHVLRLVFRGRLKWK